MSYTQGKLKIDKFGGVIGGDKKRLVLHGLAINTGHREKNAVANARRLVACWNACDGVVTEDVEAITGMDSFIVKFNEYKSQRDELLETLNGIASANPKNWDAPLNDTASFQQWAQSRARAAIQKLEGKV